MIVTLLAEAVNPVYRRNRIAKVLKTARKHDKLMTHWSGISDTLDTKGRKISYKYFKAHGNEFMKWPEAARKAHNKEHSRNDAMRTNAADAVYHNLHKRTKAFHIARGGYELPDGHNKYRLIPSNPLRKNRDETLGKHKRTMDVVKKTREYDKQVKADWAKNKAKNSLEARAWTKKLMDQGD